MMDCIDIFLRVNREDARPFGGVQLVVFGDLFQLPPVVSSSFERQFLREKYGSPYFFAAQVFEAVNLRMIELRTVYRQTQRHFINLLDNIRTRHFDHDDMMEINERHLADSEYEGLAITLCSTNATVNSINDNKLKAIASPSFEYRGKISGNFNPKNCPVDQFLFLKQDAQVMFLKNHPEGDYVNGTLGTIVNLSTDSISVSILKDGEVKIIEVEETEWEMLKYEVDSEDKHRFRTAVTGTFTQYPIKLAWAITIHKSQGKTFDNIIIDLGAGAFDHGQTYVALSRCRTLEGIQLKKPIRPRDIMVDEVITSYYEHKIRHW